MFFEQTYTTFWAKGPYGNPSQVSIGIHPVFPTSSNDCIHDLLFFKNVSKLFGDMVYSDGSKPFVFIDVIIY